MDKIITFDLTDNFIERVADIILEEYSANGFDFSRLAFVFGGKRPELFLKKELASRIKRPFLSPAFFSMDEFMGYCLSKKARLKKISELDGCYLAYNLTKEIAPDILKGREEFCRFIPWAREMLSFIEQLDLEDKKSVELNEIELKAEIGYDVPQGINLLLNRIVSIREAYHRGLGERKSCSRGFMYLMASQAIAELDFPEFERVFFCNFFYLHQTEINLIQGLLAKEKAGLFFQGSQDEWPLLKKAAREFSSPVIPSSRKEPAYKLSLYSGFDLHSQAALAREIIKSVKVPQETVIVLPRPESLIPLLSEISAYVQDFNVSMGYPLERGAVYHLFESIFKAQASRSDEGYYARDYLGLLSNPLVKNLRLINDEPAITRMLIHKIEEVVLGIEDSPVGGSLFINPGDIEGLEEIYLSALRLAKGAGFIIKDDDLKAVLRQLRQLMFTGWEGIEGFPDFIRQADKLINVLLDKGMLENYPVNLKIAEAILKLKDEIEASSFFKEPFPKEEIFKIFLDRLSGERISFSGSPLKGLQILGLLETRSLNFKNVIVLDVNDQALPYLKIYEPLVPQEVMVSLGLNRLENEEQLQRYIFRRLLAGAEKAHLIFQENPRNEKSRFVEELIWQRQKQEGRLDVLEIPKACFSIQSGPQRLVIEKEKEVLEYLKNIRYSASSIDVYLSCPLRFYYRYVLGLKKKEDIADGPEAVDIGLFVHKLLEEAFTGFKGRGLVIDRDFRKYFRELLEQRFEEQFKKKMRSEGFILKEIIGFKLDKFLDREESRKVKEVLSLEEPFSGKIWLAQEWINFIGKTDRVDRLDDENVLVIDYKTGAASLPRVIGAIESRDLSREYLQKNIHSFQFPLYIYFISKRYPQDAVNAALYNLKDLSDNSGFKSVFSPQELEKNAGTMDAYLTCLEYLMEELFNPDVPFLPEPATERSCQYCPFTLACKK